MRKIHSASAGLGSGLERLMAEGDGVGYQLPDDLPGDRKFAFSVAEAEFVERMGAFLSSPGQEGPPRFILSEVAELYVLPRPYLYSKPRILLQKSACALMRLHAIAMAHNDWAAYRREDEKDDRVIRSSAFASTQSRERLRKNPAGRRGVLAVVRHAPLAAADIEALWFRLHGPAALSASYSGLQLRTRVGVGNL